MADTEAHIPDVYEEVLGVVDITTLNSCQYCVVCDPVGADGKPQLGQKKVIKVRAQTQVAQRTLGAQYFKPQKAPWEFHTSNYGQSPYAVGG